MAITTERAKELILTSGGRIFRVTFIKRSDQTRRVMVARLGVTKWLKGGELPFDPEAYNLIPVADMNKQGYRMVPIDAILEIKIGGKVEQIQTQGDTK